MTAQARAVIDRLKTAMKAGNRMGVNQACRSLIDMEASLGGQWKAIATVLQHNGEHELAERAATVWLRQAGGVPAVAFERALILAQAGRAADAAVQLADIPAAVPNPGSHAFMRGTLAANLGRFDEARDWLRIATAVSPQAGQAWLALAMVGPVADEDAEAIARAAPATSKAPPSERAAWLYALGKSRSERREYTEAFRAFDNGAALMQSQRRYSAEADAAEAERIKSGWTRDAVRGSASRLASENPPRPIFVTGLPRSGTTLVEQILVSHSAVDGGDELGLFRHLEREMGGVTYHHFADLERHRGARPLRALYDHLIAQRYPGEGRVVDKTLNASRTMGLIATLFPDAPIVWVRRDSLDCAWSAYRSWFLRGLDWSWSLTDIAAHFRVEDELFDHWTALLGDRILVVDYADLVTDPGFHIARIAAHCGLVLEPAQLSPHRTQRVVTTTSLAQVRQPIHTRALGSAAPYRRHLEPFVAAYRGDHARSA